MNREDQLDSLITALQQEKELSSDFTDEIRVRLAAAGRLARYQEINVPLALAEGVERRLRRYIRQQARVVSPRSLHMVAHPVPFSRFRGRQRLWKSLLGAAILLFLLCVGTLTVAAYALPGDPLYGVKQARNQFILLFTTSSSARASNTISQLQGALNDLEDVVKDGRSSGVIQQALNAVIAQTKAAQMAVANMPAGSLHTGMQQDLANVLLAENQTLRALLNKVSWSMRLAFTRQLGSIGQAVPTIKQVIVSRQSSDTLAVTVIGTNFAPQAQLVINGQLQENVGQQNPTQLIGTFNRHEWKDSGQMVGVLNPDGTAVQMQVIFHDNGGEQEGGDDSGGHGGHGSDNGTPTPGDDHGGPGKGGSGNGGSGGKGSDG
ncbi:MAG TPA: hypothetical protein VFN35_35230 [Ktedonobacteraceae bacterium]|nr:hypothetical protein [Ktedonobacteraceae bacterium]